MPVRLLVVVLLALPSAALANGTEQSSPDVLMTFNSPPSVDVGDTVSVSVIFVADVATEGSAVVIVPGHRLATLEERSTKYLEMWGGVKQLIPQGIHWSGTFAPETPLTLELRFVADACGTKEIRASAGLWHMGARAPEWKVNASEAICIYGPRVPEDTAETKMPQPSGEDGEIRPAVWNLEDLEIEAVPQRLRYLSMTGEDSARGYRAEESNEASGVAEDDPCCFGETPPEEKPEVGDQGALRGPADCAPFALTSATGYVQVEEPTLVPLGSRYMPFGLRLHRLLEY